MTQPVFPSTIGTQSRSAKFLTMKTVVRKAQKNDGQTGSWCLDKAVLAEGGGGVLGQTTVLSEPQASPLLPCVQHHQYASLQCSSFSNPQVCHSACTTYVLPCDLGNAWLSFVVSFCQPVSLVCVTLAFVAASSSSSSSRMLSP